jgi:hypothetical protein
MRRVMYIECKSDGLVGPARIGWVSVRDKGHRLDYGDQVFRTLSGQGFKSNYRDMATGTEYWISGCHKDGLDALYGTTAEIDEDALEEYWVNIREQPQNRGIRHLNVKSKY